MDNTFIVTELCNMHCSFCCFSGEHKAVKDKKRVYTVDELEGFIGRINDKCSVSLMGGEPLLFPAETIHAIKCIKTAFPDIYISLYTNASLLTSDVVDTINNYDIHMVFSINLYGEKGIENLIKKSRKNTNIIELVQKVQKKTIRTVYLRKNDFAVDMFSLHHIFNCPIELSADNTQIKYWTEDDIVHLNKELTLLYTLSPTLNWFEMVNTVQSLCLCDTHYDIFSNVFDVHSKDFYLSRSMYGCCGLKDAMGDKLYNKYIVTIQNHLHRNG